MPTIPRVAIVGRPNVGKSTLFNRLIGSRRAIVDSVAGSTRDRNVAPVDWGGTRFDLVDTGGIFEDPETPIDEQIRSQVVVAIEDAALVCWMVDGREGILGDDLFLAEQLRSLSGRVLLVVNKIDGSKHEADALEFHRLGIEPLLEISAEHGLGISELLDTIVELLPSDESAPESHETSIAIVGRPNVGKSSLLNRLCGTERAVVSEMAGTTRDAVDTLIERDGERYRIVDTAGIRRRGKMAGNADRLAVMLAERALARADCCLLVMDASVGVTSDDAGIAGKVVDAGRGVILVFNKWDVVEERERMAKELEAQAREKLPHLDFAPIIFISALSGKHVAGIFPRLKSVRIEQQRRVTTPELNRFLEKAIARFRPRSRDGREARLTYMTQVGVAPPRFVVFGNRSRRELDPTYPRYLSRRLREVYGFEGTPIRVSLKKKDQKRRSQ